MYPYSSSLRALKYPVKVGVYLLVKISENIQFCVEQRSQAHYVDLLYRLDAYWRVLYARHQSANFSTVFCFRLRTLCLLWKRLS